MPPLRPRRLVLTAALLAVVATASGCGFLDAMAHPEKQQEESAAGSAATAPPPATPTRDPDAPVVLADVLRRGLPSGEEDLLGLERWVNEGGREAPPPRRRPMNGMRPLSIRSPSFDRTAGSTVTEPSIATATTRMVPVPNDSNVTLPVR